MTPKVVAVVRNTYEAENIVKKKLLRLKVLDAESNKVVGVDIPLIAVAVVSTIETESVVPFAPEGENTKL